MVSRYKTQYLHAERIQAHAHKYAQGMHHRWRPETGSGMGTIGDSGISEDTRSMHYLRGARKWVVRRYIYYSLIYYYYPIYVPAPISLHSCIRLPAEV